MTYYTKHTLEIIPENNDIYQEFVNNTGFIEDDETKWYSREKDCINLSRENKGYLIVVTGEGNETGDVWKQAFLSGCKVWEWKLELTIPEVPEEILQQALNDFKVSQRSNIEERLKQLEEEQIKLKRLLSE